MSNKIRVMILEDDDDCYLAEKYVLEQQHDIAIVERVTSKKECLKKVEECQPDVILMDINLTGSEDHFGIDSAIEVRLTNPKTKIIMLSGLLNEDTIRSTLGIKVADNYILKTNLEGIPNFIRNAVSGDEIQFENQIMHVMLRDYNKILENTLKVDLTERELQILQLLYRDYSAEKIAEVACIEIQSVRNVLQKISKKCYGWSWKWKTSKLSAQEIAKRAKALGLF